MSSSIVSTDVSSVVQSFFADSQQQDLFFTFKADGLPDADFIVTDFDIQEMLSGLYQIEVPLSARQADYDLTQLTDKPALLIIHDRYQSQPRYFHGIVAAALRGNSGHHFTSYHLTLMPQLHRLRFGSDCRIFQNRDVVDIAMAVLQENGVSELEDLTTEPHEKREYLTQYHELHFDFVNRILAEEGILYYFRHENDRHIMVLTDHSINCPDCESDNMLEYNAISGGLTRQHYIDHFIWCEQVMVSDVNQRDHYFKMPHHSYSSEHSAPSLQGLSAPLSIYHYPGRYKADHVGADFARYQLESLRKAAATGQGAGRCQYLRAGGCFTMLGHNDAKMNRRFLVTDTRHHGTQSTGQEQAEVVPTVVTTSFSCILDDVPWRPRRSATPLVNGPQMAIVCGPEGEEIYCDEYGRVKVTFPWDRYSKQDDKSSCWIRVASNWAGGLWGHIAIPRIGQHVIVDYLEGDPDQPIIVGRAYNSLNQPPYQLPEHKTRMVIKSKTHKGNGFNELTFEDEKDREVIYVHAQKDIDIDVLHDRDKNVDNDQRERIGHDKTIEVGHIHKEMIGKNMHLNVAELKETHVGKVENSYVGEFKNITVGKQLTIRVGASQLVMKEDGTILLSGVNFNFTASDSVQINGKVIDLN